MWSLPDIVSLNARAAARDQNEYRRLVETELIDPGNGKIGECDYCNKKVRASKNSRAPRGIGWVGYDIFSDDIKYHGFVCPKCREISEDIPDGFFECVDCQRIHITNITWELYTANCDEGTLCLNCYAAREISNPHSWLWFPLDGSETLDFERLRKAPHIIAVKGPTHGLEFLANTELDSSNGRPIPGSRGVPDLDEAIEDAKARGYKRAAIVLDAWYQFAVSIGVYVYPEDLKAKTIAA